MIQYGGLLGSITEAVDIQAELDCSPERAFAIQREGLRRDWLTTAAGNVVYAWTSVRAGRDLARYPPCSW